MCACPVTAGAPVLPDTASSPCVFKASAAWCEKACCCWLLSPCRQSRMQGVQPWPGQEMPTACSPPQSSSMPSPPCVCLSCCKPWAAQAAACVTRQDQGWPHPGLQVGMCSCLPTHLINRSCPLRLNSRRDCSKHLAPACKSYSSTLYNPWSVQTLPTLFVWSTTGSSRHVQTSQSTWPLLAGASALRTHVLDIGRILGTVVSASLTRREALLAGQRLAAASLYTALGSPSWLADPPARDALDKVALVSLWLSSL